MNRLTHKRTKGPASTPAQRLVELQSEINYLTGALEVAQREASEAQDRLRQFTSFGGVSFGGIRMGQFWCELVLWEALLNERDYKAIFELGTWEGGFSWYLWAQTQARHMSFCTYDAVEPDRVVPGFARIDVLHDYESVGSVIRLTEPSLILVDNGNKPRELAIYSQEVRHPDTRFVVHDWGTEFQPEDIPEGVEMVHQEYCERLGSASRVFRNA